MNDDAIVDPCALLPQTLRKERGMPTGGPYPPGFNHEPDPQKYAVAIWRPGTSGGMRQGVTVGEFLSRSENQSGRWLIDGGWGGPPGPVGVEWNGSQWEYRGYPPYEWRYA